MKNTIDYLIEATEKIWKKYNEHPFVKGIENGTLKQEKFRFYIIQDHLYLKEYVKVFAIGIAKSKSLEGIHLFSNYIKTLTDSEMNIQKDLMNVFNVTQEELDSTHRSLDNLSYTSYMLRIAYEDGEAEILTAILACAYSYEFIANKIIENNPNSVNHRLYGAWIKTYASKEYAAGNVILIDRLNSLTKHYNADGLKHFVDIFTTCSLYEFAFWEMSWNMRS